MDQPKTTNRAPVIGKIARVELCACAGSLTLSLGALSIRLELAAAEDVALTLMRALGDAAAGGERPDACDGQN